MHRSIITALVTALFLSGSLKLAAEAITSSAPDLPDLAGGLGLDMPLPGLDLPGANPSPIPPTVAEKSAPVAETAKPANTPIPTPARTEVLAVSVTPVTVEPTPTTVVEAVAAPAKIDFSTLQGLEAYFPMQVGAKWEYKSAAGQVRLVECVSRDSVGKSVTGSYRVTTANIPQTQSWKFVDGKIVLATGLTTLRAGWTRLTEPKAKEVTRWVYERRDGTASYYKQEAGPLKAGGKKYDDGIVVTERTLKGAEQVSLRKWFYAKGVGLVAEGAYDATGAALPEQTYELQVAQ
jgi:hypothetical protein